MHSIGTGGVGSVGMFVFKDYGIGESAIFLGSRVDRVRKKNQNSLWGWGRGFDGHTRSRNAPAEVSNLSFEEYKLFKRTNAEIRRCSGWWRIWESSSGVEVQKKWLNV